MVDLGETLGVLGWVDVHGYLLRGRRFRYGDRLGVQSEDGSIVLFDVAAGLRIGTRYRTGDLRGAMEVADDTGSIITATDTGVVEISVDAAEWQRIACAAVDRRITEAELRAIVPGVEMIDDPCAGFD